MPMTLGEKNACFSSSDNYYKALLIYIHKINVFICVCIYIKIYDYIHTYIKSSSVDIKCFDVYKMLELWTML